MKLKGVKRIGAAFLALFLLAGSASTAMAQEQRDGWEENWDRLGMEETTVLSRAELVTAQTLHGVGFGIQACIVLECDSPRSAIGLPALGGLAGLGGSLYLTQEGIAPGKTAAINSGVVWGGYLSLRSANLAGSFYRESTMAMMAGQLVGLGGGLVMAEALRPTAGDVAMVNHGGIWATALYLMVTAGVLRLDASYELETISTIVVPLAGAAAGAATALRYPMARPRVRVISASGLVGGLLGVTIPYLIFEENLDGRVGSAGAAFGSLAGLAAGAIFTQGWDGEYRDGGPEFGVALFPSLDGDGMQLSVSGRF